MQTSKLFHPEVSTFITREQEVEAYIHDKFLKDGPAQLVLYQSLFFKSIGQAKSPRLAEPVHLIFQYSRGSFLISALDLGHHVVIDDQSFFY